MKRRLILCTKNKIKINRKIIKSKQDITQKDSLKLNYNTK